MDRETLLPLSVSALLAVCLHASVVMWPGLTLVNAQQTIAPIASKLSQPDSKAKAPKPKPEPESKPEPKPKPKPKPEPKPKAEPKPVPAAAAIPPKPLDIGRDGEPVRSTVAWIPYDDFKELMAQQSMTIQPALQTQADPVPNAPIEMNPSTPKSIPAIVPLPSLAQQTKQTSPSSSIAQPKLTTNQNKTPAANTKNQTVKTPAQLPVRTSVTDTPKSSQANSDNDAPLDKQPHDKPTLARTAPSSHLKEQSAAPAGSPNPDAANIVLPQGQGAPPLTSPNDKTAQNTPKNKLDADIDSAVDSSEKTQQSSTNATLSPSDDTNRLALAPLKIPHTRGVTESATPNKPDESIAASKLTTPADTSSHESESAVTNTATTTNESNEARPTSVPRSDRESVATQSAPMPDRVVMGKVLVSDGIEIKTVRPDIHIATLYTASPRNPIANIVFDKTGQVVRAELVLSSGFADVDSPVLNSLYRWRATGKKLQDHKSDTFTIHRMKLLFVEERVPDKQMQVETTGRPSASPESSESTETPQSPGPTPNE